MSAVLNFLNHNWSDVTCTIASNWGTNMKSKSWLSMVKDPAFVGLRIVEYRKKKCFDCKRKWQSSYLSSTSSFYVSPSFKGSWMILINICNTFTGFIPIVFLTKRQVTAIKKDLSTRVNNKHIYSISSWIPFSVGEY